MAFTLSPLPKFDRESTRSRRSPRDGDLASTSTEPRPPPLDAARLRPVVLEGRVGRTFEPPVDRPPVGRPPGRLAVVGRVERKADDDDDDDFDSPAPEEERGRDGRELMGSSRAGSLDSQLLPTFERAVKKSCKNRFVCSAGYELDGRDAGRNWPAREVVWPAGGWMCGAEFTARTLN